MNTRRSAILSRSRRLLCLFLASIFLLTSFPFAAFAEDGPLTVPDTGIEESVDVGEKTADESVAPDELDEYVFDPASIEYDEIEQTGNTPSVFDPAQFSGNDSFTPLSEEGADNVATAPQRGEDLFDGVSDPYEVPAASITGTAESIEEEPTPDENATRTGELAHERDEFSKTYALSDGRFETLITDAPAHYRNNADVFIDIVTDLMPSALADDTFGTLRTLSTEGDLTFAAFGESEIASFAQGDWKVGLSFIGAQAATPLRLGDHAYYPEVDEGKDIEYRSYFWGIKETLLLKDRSALEDSYEFKITFEGLRLERDLVSGQMRLVDETSGEEVFALGSIEVTDSAYDGLKGEFASCEDAYWSIEEMGAGWAILSANIDAAWMDDAARVFPVRIDPPIIFTWTADKGIASTVDSRVCSADPAASYPSTTELRVGYYDASTGHNRSYIATALTAATLATKRIDKATVTVHQ